MELFLPSFLLLILAGVVVFGVFPNMTPLLLAVFAGVSLAYAIKNHYDLFSDDYAGMTWATGAVAFAPYLLVGVVVVFAIGYLLFLFGSGKRPTMNLPGPSIPPPETATNIITNAIGNGLKAAGVNVKNTPKSLVSLSPSMKESLSNSELRSILESRLSKQV